MIRVPLHLLEKALSAFLEQYFVSDVAAKCSEVILWAELRGKTGQGLLKLFGTEPLQSVKAEAPLEILEKTPVSALYFAHKQPSFWVAQKATEAAIEKSLKNGVGIVGINGIRSSTGPLGFYAEKAAKKDLICIVCARSAASVAPFDAKLPLFGTDPIAFGFPTETDPIVFDMATAAITWYELVLAKMKNQKIPEGVALGPDGALTTDPAQAMSGCILPFDRSYKGSGLGMMMELLAGPLVGSSYCDCETFDKDWGVFILCLSPDLLAGTKAFKRNASDLLQIIKQKSFQKTGRAARLPGEESHARRCRILQEGSLDVEEDVARLLGLTGA